VATPDLYSTPQDTPLIPDPGVLVNDTDADGNKLKAIQVSDPAHGALTVFNASGTFIYMPDPGYFGPDSFTYKVNDGLVIRCRQPATGGHAGPLLNAAGYPTDPGPRRARQRHRCRRQQAEGHPGF